jgi:hypothetical protein
MHHKKEESTQRPSAGKLISLFCFPARKVTAIQLCRSPASVPPATHPVPLSKMTTTTTKPLYYITRKIRQPTSLKNMPSSASSSPSSSSSSSSPSCKKSRYRRSSRRVVFFLNPNEEISKMTTADPAPAVAVVTTTTGTSSPKRKKYKCTKRKCYRKKFSMKPPAPHNTTSMLMDAYSEIDSGSDSQSETELNFAGSFLPSLTKEDYEEFFCNSSIDF